ncbi:hypothetical protein CcCBS67573_g08483 [Chytriomyces confervae]|uniref:Uncharacterized protein n=1 Tax=Chytriomyces confervae TaxID=246404 RepID=A0A507EJZ1_9FUNG|nr:hypothetical protein CcCBS67573_g08483 [Chytriomyces confervae]
MTMNQKASSKPMTRLATPAQAPMQAKPAPMQPAKAATSKQIPARPAPMAVDTFSGNMFDLPSQWVASCKPASPVARLASKAKPSKPKFTRKARAPKNSTSEVFNLQFLFNEPTKWATVPATGWATQAPTAPRRAAGSPVKGNLPNLPAKQRLRV